MIDLSLLRNEIDIIANKLKTRGFILNINLFNSIENSRKLIQIQTENLQSKCNNLSKEIGKNKNIKNNFQELKNQVLEIKKLLIINKKKLFQLKLDMKKFLLSIPNIPDPTVPIGINYSDNRKIQYWGKIKKYSFKVKDHISIGKQHNGFDWFSAVQISGSRFVIMKNKIALLYRALGQFMLDVHINQHGYSETYVPYLVNHESLYGTGQLPKFEDELFYVSTKYKKIHQNKYILIPTAEVALTNMFKNKIIHKNDLPIMLTANTPCFRAENISYGQDKKGLIRMHQFDKVEIFQISHPNQSIKTLENLTYHAERILQLLELPYRKILLCTGDMGFSASKTYDLEVWFPSQNNYREISSCSNMSDFQARRINIKYCTNKTSKKKLVHTVNGSGLAIGRTLAAILENYQQCDGTVKIPKVLQKKYMNDMNLID
ncbi:serine--tRNA ligase [Buchnera aphidicola]|uniref:serine--tRNA ligase n=1 Tax=Buchnera aphidicola TaxID=9 RepID=UPI003464E608